MIKKKIRTTLLLGEDLFWYRYLSKITSLLGLRGIFPLTF